MAKQKKKSKYERISRVMAIVIVSTIVIGLLLSLGISLYSYFGS